MGTTKGKFKYLEMKRDSNVLIISALRYTLRSNAAISPGDRRRYETGALSITNQLRT